MKTTRRAMLGAVAATPLIALPAIAGEPTDAPTIRPSFLRKLARFRALDAACNAQEDGPCAAARQRYDSLVADIPHTTAYMGKNHDGKRIVFSTESSTDVAVARSLAARPISAKQYMNGCIKIALADQRRAALREEACQISGLAAANERSNRLSSVTADAEWAFIRTPVVSAAELALKLELMIERDSFACDDAPNVILVDVRALAGRDAVPTEVVGSPQPEGAR